MQLLVDPIIVIPPDNGASTEDVFRFLDNLESWSSLSRGEQQSLFLSEACLEAICTDNRYPDYSMFKSLCKQHKLVEIDPKTIFSACKGIIENTPRLEERIDNIETIEVYEERTTITPDLLLRLPSAIANAFRKTLGQVSYAYEEIQPSPIADLGLATYDSSETESAHIISSIETNSGEIPINTHLPMIFSPNHLQKILGLKEFWQDSSTALEWAINELKDKGYIQKSHIIAIHSFDERFNESIRSQGYQDRGSDLRKIFIEIAKLLVGITPPQSTQTNHILRNVKCTNRDKDGNIWDPWRIWITTSFAAIRLHYWKNQGRFLFSCVVPHENMTIFPVSQNLVFYGDNKNREANNIASRRKST